MTGKPERYVVLVWLYDHWGATFSTDDKHDADRVRASFEKATGGKQASLVVDTDPTRDTGD